MPGRGTAGADVVKRERIVIVGGSVAAVTAASALRADGFPGEVVLLSEETRPPYSRVPLSKGFLAGTDTAATIELPSLSEDVEVRLATRAERLDVAGCALHLAGGEPLSFDGLLICTGARARTLAGPAQRGEHLVRSIEDVLRIRAQLPQVSSAIVLGAGFLGTEVAATLTGLGIDVRVITIGRPLVSHVGEWMADVLVRRARERGVVFESAASAVEVLGNPLSAVRVDASVVREADIVISAVGDAPNVDWLTGSGLPIEGGVHVDAAGLAAPHIGAAGDVAAVADGTTVRRSPNWTSAVTQARAVARNLMNGTRSPIAFDPYHWTEQFGLSLKISGPMRCAGQPEILGGDPAQDSALLRWRHADGSYTAAALNYPVPVAKLKRLAARTAQLTG